MTRFFIVTVFFVLTIAEINCIDEEDKVYKISGGKFVEEGKYLFMASLQQKGEHFCGGTIYNSKYILTAAHCVFKKKSSNPTYYGLTALVGTNNLKSGGTVHSFSNVIIHSSYNITDNSYDIALVQVEKPIDSKTTEFVTIYTSPWLYGIAETLGWGSSHLGGPLSNILQTVSLYVIPNNMCHRKINFPIYKTQVCLLSESGKGSCEGDSGGAAIVGGKLIGITSFGRSCALGYPEVYTKVSNYIPWINSNTI